MKSIIKYVLIVVAVLGLSIDALAQQRPADVYQIKLNGLKNQLKTSADRAGRKAILDQLDGATLDLVIFAILKHSDPKSFGATISKAEFVQKIENARIDKQVGSGSSTSGTTTLVEKGSVPSILGFAVNNGAIAKSVSGSTITFTGNPVGILHALSDKGFIQSYDDDQHDALMRNLRKFSFSVSFDASRGNQPTTPGSTTTFTFTGDKQQLSQYWLRWDIINKRDPRHPSYDTRWQSLVAKQGVPLAGLVHTLAVDATFIGVVDHWFLSNTFQKPILDAGDADVNSIDAAVEKEFETAGEGAAHSLAPPLAAQIISAGKAYGELFETRDSILEAVSNGAIVTLEYTNNRDLNQPSTSNLKLIAEASPKNGKFDLTSNASLTFFNEKPLGATKRIRDFQASGQLDVPLGPVASLGSITFTAAGKFQHLAENTLDNSGQIVARKGNMGIGQFKFTIPIKDSGIKIPLSVTFSNRTELIKEREVRGNIGVTFDLDSIFAKVKP